MSMQQKTRSIVCKPKKNKKYKKTMSLPSLSKKNIKKKIETSLGDGHDSRSCDNDDDHSKEREEDMLLIDNNKYKKRKSHSSSSSSVSPSSSKRIKHNDNVDKEENHVHYHHNNNHKEDYSHVKITDNILLIDKKLNQRLHGQERVLREVVNCLVYHHQLRKEPKKKYIIPMVFSGQSGSGKTTLCKEIINLFDIDEHEHVYFDLSRITDETQINLALGSGPGLVGHTSKSSLPFMLLEAIGKPYTDKIDIDEDTSKPPKKKMTITKERIKPLPALILHLDELDKAHHSFLKVFINFLENGRLTSASGVTFELPDGLPMFVLFTANYGEEALATLDRDELLNYDIAINLIKEDMRYQGLTNPMIGRLTHIYPFFKLDDEYLDNLAMETIKEHLENANDFHARKYDFYDHKSLELLHAMVQKPDDKLGVRQANTDIKHFIMRTSNDIRRYLNINLPGIELPLNPDPIFKGISYKKEDFGQLRQLIKDHPDSFAPEIQRAVNTQMKDESLQSLNFLFLNYTYKDVTHILSSMIAQTDKAINIFNVQNNNIDARGGHITGLTGTNNNIDARNSSITHINSNNNHIDARGGTIENLIGENNHVDANHSTINNPAMINISSKTCSSCNVGKPLKQFEQKRKFIAKNDAQKESIYYRSYCHKCRMHQYRKTKHVVDNINV
jgi:ribulose bisphosphate carboxylase small subunit